VSSDTFDLEAIVGRPIPADTESDLRRLGPKVTGAIPDLRLVVFVVRDNQQDVARFYANPPHLPLIEHAAKIERLAQNLNAALSCPPEGVNLSMLDRSDRGIDLEILRESLTRLEAASGNLATLFARRRGGQVDRPSRMLADGVAAVLSCHGVRLSKSRIGILAQVVALLRPSLGLSAGLESFKSIKRAVEQVSAQRVTRGQIVSSAIATAIAVQGRRSRSKSPS
jgi:hypothetical protein